MDRPVIFLLETETQKHDLIRRELEQRYAAQYQVICEQAPTAAFARLGELQRAGQEVAVILAACRMPEIDGPEFLVRAGDQFPQAKRGMLLDWGDHSCSDELIINAMSLNQIDAFADKPVGGPGEHLNEDFHHFLSEFLTEWARENRPQFEIFHIIGEQWDRRSYELRDLLSRNAIRFSFYDADSAEGRRLLEQTGTLDAPQPVVLCYDGRVFTNPSNADLARFVGVRTAYEAGADRERALMDVVIVGAGPSGLSAAVNSGSEGLQTVMIEREALGGQAGMSSRIRNYLGFPTGIAGGELADRAFQQARLFGVESIFTLEVTGLEARGSQRVVTLSDGAQIATHTVILAMGVTYRRLEIPSLEKLVGAGVFYGAVGSEARALRGKEIFIVGGANSAGQAAVHLSKFASQVTMVVRGSSLSINMSEYLIQELRACDNVRVLPNAQVIDGGGAYRLERLTIQHNDTGQTETQPAEALFVMIGAIPHTGWLPPQVLRDPVGFILTGVHLLKDGAPPPGWPLRRQPLPLETSLPGVFAVGDVRHRSVKRVASAVGEGSMGVQYVHQYLAEGQ